MLCGELCSRFPTAVGLLAAIELHGHLVVPFRSIELQTLVMESKDLSDLVSVPLLRSEEGTDKDTGPRSSSSLRWTGSKHMTSGGRGGTSSARRGTRQRLLLGHGNGGVVLGTLGPREETMLLGRDDKSWSSVEGGGSE